MIKTNWEVRDASKQYRDNNTSRNFRNNLSEEVSRHRVHVIVYFTQEYRSLIWENKNDVLDGVESDSHGHEEKGSISVLNSLSGLVTVLEKNDNKDGSDDSHNHLNVGCLRESENI